MNEVIAVKNLGKSYKDFKLDNISFNLPGGCIMGLIGENGAGKSTTIKLLLGLIKKESGSVCLLGKEDGALDEKLKEQIGVVMDECCFPETLSAKEVGIIMKSIYKTWEQKKYNDYIAQFSLPKDKNIKDYSRGMKMKLSIAVALSHDTRLLILDEATSGLDPIIRDNMLDIFLDFIQDENHSILMSSHIVSDLEKVCDYITFIHDGKIIFSQEKDVLMEKYGVLKCSQEELRGIAGSAVVAQRTNMFGVDALVEKRKIPNGFVVDRAGIEEIMLYFTAAKGKAVRK